jgi:hypothetical protein
MDCRVRLASQSAPEEGSGQTLGEVEWQVQLQHYLGLLMFVEINHRSLHVTFCVVQLVRRSRLPMVAISVWSRLDPIEALRYE